MTQPHSVPVLIATLATPQRADYLRRALRSLGHQGEVDGIPVEAWPIVIVNGAGADPALVDELSAIPGLTLLQRAEASLSGALAAGRQRVDAPFFAQLDDDDEFLPGALALRLRRMQQPDRPDAVVTNMQIRNGPALRQSMTDLAAVARDPLAALMASNWMLPGCALFRTETVDAGVFEAAPEFLEWTFIGLLLASRHRVAFLETPSAVHYAGHPFSVDRSRECVLGRPRAFDAALALRLPATIRHRLRVKQGAAWHSAAEAALRGADARTAWAAHLRSLLAPGGWRYVTYTRHLLRARDA